MYKQCDIAGLVQPCAAVAQRVFEVRTQPVDVKKVVKSERPAIAYHKQRQTACQFGYCFYHSVKHASA